MSTASYGFQGNKIDINSQKEKKIRKHVDIPSSYNIHISDYRIRFLDNMLLYYNIWYTLHRYQSRLID